MESFDKFVEGYWSVDASKRVLTVTENGSGSTAYGHVQMRCDGAHDGVHEFQMKIQKNSGRMTIGIDEGRTYSYARFYWTFVATQCNHYALMSTGKFFKKGKSPKIR